MYNLIGESSFIVFLLFVLNVIDSRVQPMKQPNRMTAAGLVAK